MAPSKNDSVDLAALLEGLKEKFKQEILRIADILKEREEKLNEKEKELNSREEFLVGKSNELMAWHKELLEREKNMSSLEDKDRPTTIVVEEGDFESVSVIKKEETPPPPPTTIEQNLAELWQEFLPKDEPENKTRAPRRSTSSVLKQIAQLAYTPKHYGVIYRKIIRKLREKGLDLSHFPRVVGELMEIGKKRVENIRKAERAGESRESAILEAAIIILGWIREDWERKVIPHDRILDSLSAEDIGRKRATVLPGSENSITN